MFLWYEFQIINIRSKSRQLLPILRVALIIRSFQNKQTMQQDILRHIAPLCDPTLCVIFLMLDDESSLHAHRNGLFRKLTLFSLFSSLTISGGVEATKAMSFSQAPNDRMRCRPTRKLSPWHPKARMTVAHTPIRHTSRL